MINKDIKISHLIFLLNTKFGEEWKEWEPETIMSEIGFPDYLVMEKIYVLQTLSKGLNEAISIPEFFCWLCSIVNNDYAEFETLEMPNCLEMAWAIIEVKRVAQLLNVEFKPTEEFCDITGYLLKEEGFSKTTYPFEFLSEKYFTPGQTEEDVALKNKGIQAYIAFMDKSLPTVET